MTERPDRCGLCRFWPRSERGEREDEEEGFGFATESECRRRAPDRSVNGWGCHPIVDRTHWCGEFEARKPAQVAALGQHQD